LGFTSWAWVRLNVRTFDVLILEAGEGLGKTIKGGVQFT